MTIWDTTFDTSGRPLVIAHRGGVSGPFENTLMAFNAAHRAGADVIETDISLTRDHVAVCRHDAGLAETTFAGLQETEPHVPRFSEAAKTHPAFYLDLKEVTLARKLALLDTIGASEARADWIAGIDSLDTAKVFAVHFPKLRQLALMTDRAQLSEFAQLRLGNWMRVHEPRVSSGLLAELRREGFRIMITCGGGSRPIGDIDAAGVKRLLAFSPDALIVNDPALVIDALKR